MHNYVNKHLCFTSFFPQCHCYFDKRDAYSQEPKEETRAPVTNKNKLAQLQGHG